MALTTASSGLSSMVTSRSPLLLTLIRQQSFNCVDNDRAYNRSIMPLLIFHLQPHPNSFGLSPLPPSFTQTLLRHFSLPPYVPNSVIIHTFTRASFFNWASPCPSSPCQLLTGFRRIPCASPTEAPFCVCVRSFTKGFRLIFTAGYNTRCQPQYYQYQGVLCGARVCGTVGF